MANGLPWLVIAFRLKEGKKQNKFDSSQNGTSYMFMRGNHKSGLVRYLYLLSTIALHNSITSDELEPLKLSFNLFHGYALRVQHVQRVVSETQQR